MNKLFASWRGDIISILSGFSLVFAFAPYDFKLLSLISIACLFLCWHSTNRQRAAWRGWLFGVGLFGGGVHWIFISIHDVAHVHIALASLITVTFIAILAIFPALAGYLARLLTGPENTSGNRTALMLVYPASWVFLEWLRGWFLTGFTWLQVGYSQVDWPLAGAAPIIGVYGVSWLVCISAGLLVLMLNTEHKRSAIYLGAFATIWVTGYGCTQIPWTQPMSQSFKISLVQGNIPQEIKWAPELRRSTLNHYLRMTREHWDSDLVVWPETAIPAFADQIEYDLKLLSREADSTQTSVLAGILTRKNSGSYFNSILTLGKQSGLYHKSHLVPFTEYLPFKSVLSDFIDFIDVPMSDFSHGESRQSPLKIDGVGIGLSICYEDAFGEEVILQMPDANILINVSNDAWFGKSAAAWQHSQIARMRAIETRRPLLRATNTGVTAAFSPMGKLVAQLPANTSDVLTVTIVPMSGTTPYAMFGNIPILIGLSIILILAWTGRHRFRGTSTSTQGDEPGFLN